MPECCGSERSGNFCPNCGVELIKQHSLYTLLEHCRVSASSIKKRIEIQAVKELVNNDRRLASHNRSLAKWEDWAEALEKAIENKEPEIEELLTVRDADMKSLSVRPKTILKRDFYDYKVANLREEKVNDSRNSGQVATDEIMEWKKKILSR